MLFDIALPAVLGAALLLDALIGDPRWLWSKIPHPVALFGALIGWADRRLNRRDADSRRLRSTLLLIALVTLAGAIGSFFAWLSAVTVWGWMIEAVIAFSLIAQRDLYEHVRRVAVALINEGLPGGRREVAMIVGRDPQALDEGGVCRAAIESLAENFADGVVAPVFWYLVAGLPGLVIYKAVNTADSMIGHKTDHYLAFGWASARFDDLLNLVPSRLSGLIFIVASVAMPGGDPKEAAIAMWRDAPGHKSPSAGWPEAALAGALGIALAGPRRYHGEMVRDAWMGRNGRARCTAADIQRSLALYVYACVLWGLTAIAVLTWAV
jgi:adenosylcobinamide-phosphate synthase